MNTAVEDINTEPVENLIVEVLKIHRDKPLLFSEMMKQMPVEEIVFRKAVKNLLDDKTVRISFGWMWLNS